MRSFIAILTLTVVAFTALAQVIPSWWYTYNVFEPNSTPDDYVAVNQGQLKNFAKAGVAEFNARLPGGAGDELNTLIGSWLPSSAEADDYQVVTVGQLKALGDVFYQRLEQVRLTTVPDWLPIVVPWSGQAVTSPANADVVNIGQVKHLFAQLDGNRHQHGDLSDPSANPADYQFGIAWLQDSTGSGNPDYQAIELDTTLLVYEFALVSGGGQTVTPNAVSADPIIVKLLHQNAPAANVAVTLSTGGSAETHGKLGTSSAGPWQSELTLLTNTQGQVQVWWQAPNQSNQSVSLSATAPGQTAPLVIPVGTGSGEGPNVPGTPTVLVHPQVVPEWRIKYMGFDMGEIGGEDDAWGYIHNYFGIHDWFWSWTRGDYFSHFVSTSSYESPSTYLHPWHNWDLWYSSAQAGWFRAGGSNAIDLGNPNETRSFIGETGHPQVNETTFAAITDSNNEILSWKPLTQPWWTQVRFKVDDLGNYDWKKTWLVCREDAWIDGPLQTGNIPTWAAGFGPVAIEGNTSVAAIVTIEVKKNSPNPKVEIQYLSDSEFPTSVEEIYVTEEGTAPATTYILHFEPRVSTALANFQYRSSRFVLLPIDIRWEAKPEFANVDDNPDPWTNEINGKRIMVSAPEDDPGGDMRRELNVKVRIPGYANKPVYLKVFDVDDPSTVSDPNQVLDPNGDAGDDNMHPVGLENNWGDFITPQNGKRITVALNSSGEATATFRVNQQPGNNYRVAVAIKDADLNVLQVTNPGGQGFVTPDDKAVSGFNGSISPMLTVWRRLHIEVDSMEAVTTPKGSPDRVDAVGDYWTTDTSGLQHRQRLYLVDSLPEGNNFYERGRLKAGGAEYKIYESGSNWVSLSAAVQSAPPGFIGPVEIFDDDDQGLPSPALPKTNLITQGVKDIFKRAYIDIVERTQNPTKTIPFKLYTSVVRPWLADSSLNDAIDTNNDDWGGFWNHYLIASYQPHLRELTLNGWVMTSGDPNGAVIEGATMPPGYGPRYSVIFVETIRDATAGISDLDVGEFNTRLDEVVAHEIGHGPNDPGSFLPDYLGGNSHPETGLMGHNAPQHHFSAESLKRFRQAYRWQIP